MRMTHATALVLAALASGCRYGFDVMDATGLPSGTVYPVLRRLDGSGLVRSGWEDADSEETSRGGPRRRMYALTAAGLRAVETADKRLADARRLLERRFAPEGGEA